MRLIKIILKCFFTILLLVVVFYLGAFAGIKNNDLIGETKDFVINTPTYISRSISASIEGLPVIKIKLKDEEFQKILKTREISLKRGVLNKEVNKYSKCKVNVGREKFKGKIKLKGIFKDHWQSKDQEWSFKVKVEEGANVLGLKEFNLMKPKRRGSVNEWAYECYLRENGFVYQELKYVHLIVNKKDLGLYLIEERITKDFLEKYKLNGTIFKLDKSSLENSENWLGEYNQLFLNAPIKVVAEKDAKDSKVGIELFEKFRLGLLPASECFDIQQYAKLTALVDYTGTWHELMPHNTLYFYNANTKKIELISNDGSFTTNPYHIVSTIVGGYMDSHNRPIDDLVYEDSLFHVEYYNELRRMRSTNFGFEMESFLRPKVDSVLNYIYFEDVFYEAEVPESFSQNDKRLEYLLRKDRGVRVYNPVLKDGKFSFQVSSPFDFAIKLDGVYNDSIKVLKSDNWKMIRANPTDGIVLNNFVAKCDLDSTSINLLGYSVVGSDSVIFVDIPLK